ncbi:hypothetical protein EYF80_030944 [Liparis tanakae]|uniref:Uncharacterized protein n=1 Tax=Liparis tanakae TaxID=230148 RepID=A0A4Z2H0A8_9TELE|nr:hypothetical protein EYF80_030944 [Liparis tanakae]
MAMASMMLSGPRAKASLLWALTKRSRNSSVNHATQTDSTTNMLWHFGEHSPCRHTETHGDHGAKLVRCFIFIAVSQKVSQEEQSMSTADLNDGGKQEMINVCHCGAL